MKNRGDIKRLWVGVLIALPSGAGVALSLLGGNIGMKIQARFLDNLPFFLLGSLIGVAISGR